MDGYKVLGSREHPGQQNKGREEDMFSQAPSGPVGVGEAGKGGEEEST